MFESKYVVAHDKYSADLIWSSMHTVSPVKARQLNILLLQYFLEQGFLEKPEDYDRARRTIRNLTEQNRRKSSNKITA